MERTRQIFSSNNLHVTGHIIIIITTAITMQSAIAAFRARLRTGILSDGQIVELSTSHSSLDIADRGVTGPFPFSLREH